MNRRRFLGLTVTAGAVAACGHDGPSLDAPKALGSAADLDREIEAGGGAWYLPDAKAYVVSVGDTDRAALAASLDADDPGAFDALDLGYLAISERCPHQSCRVPFCESSGGFECNCHGSRYTAYGELTRGPANRGMDLYGLRVVDGAVTIDTSVQARRNGDVAVEIEPAGPHCI